jgi:hypothetical protein
VLIQSVIYLAIFLAAGLAVSSATANPPVSLVVLLVLWTLVIVAVPNIGRLAVEQSAEIPSSVEVEDEQQRVQQEVEESSNPIAGRWTGNPFDDHVPIRAEMYSNMVSAAQRVRDSWFDAQTRQARLVQRVSSISPAGMYKKSLQRLCQTGIVGFDLLLDNAQRYRGQLFDYVVERDRLDPDTPHLVYGGRRWFDGGTFSKKEIPMSTIPRAKALWSATGRVEDFQGPVFETVVLLAIALAACTVAFLLLFRCDPR